MKVNNYFGLGLLGGAHMGEQIMIFVCVNLTKLETGGEFQGLTCRLGIGLSNFEAKRSLLIRRFV